jgi:cyanophycin synthetase
MEALEISAALQSFNGDQNLGRANLYELRGGYVLLDYGHNPAAIAAVGRMAQEWGTGEKICVLGLPGDRTDELLADSAREAARVFGHVILREDDDLRGREPGQLATILHEIIELEHPDVRCSIIPDETEALASAVQEIRPGDIVVAFCERLERSREFLQSHGAKPVSAVVVTPELEPAPIAAA